LARDYLASSDDQEPEEAELNIGRGAFRLGVVFAVLWVGFFGYLGFYAAQIDVECAMGVEVSNCYPHPIEHLVGIVELVAGPPVAMLIFGLALAWAFKGFKGSIERERSAPVR
jgi:hypothetical protein